jgi:transcriptional regulator with XRE-family HTH domain
MTRSIHTEQYRLFIQLLRESREKSGLTQQNVADSLGMPQSFVAKYERSERRLDVIEFLEVCEILEIRPNSIIRKLAGTEH